MTIFLFQNSLFVIICESRSYKRSKVQCGSRLVLCHSHQSPPPLLPSSWTSYFFSSLFSSFPLLLLLTSYSWPPMPNCTQIFPQALFASMQRPPPSLALQAAVCNTWESWENIGQPQFDFCQTFPCKPACKKTLSSYKSLQWGTQLFEQEERNT